MRADMARKDMEDIEIAQEVAIGYLMDHGEPVPIRSRTPRNEEGVVCLDQHFEEAGNTPCGDHHGPPAKSLTGAAEGDHLA
jgi:hypothetical protein